MAETKDVAAQLQHIVRGGTLSTQKAPSKKDIEIDKLYATFVKEAEHDTVMTESEFAPFRPLFDVQTAARARKMQLSEDEETEIGTLSEDFYRRVNPYRPIHIVDDLTGNERFVLPPLFTSLSSLNSNYNYIVDSFAQATQADDNNPNSPSALRQCKAAAALYQAIAGSQDTNQLVAQRNRFDRMAKEIHQANTAPSPRTTTAPQVTQQAPAQTAATTDDFGWDDVDE